MTGGVIVLPGRASATYRRNMTDASYSSNDRANWKAAITEAKREATEYGPRDALKDARTARKAVPYLCAHWAWNEMPYEIAELLRQAMEAGYMRALSDVHQARVAGLGPLDE